MSATVCTYCNQRMRRIVVSEAGLVGLPSEFKARIRLALLRDKEYATFRFFWFWCDGCQALMKSIELRETS